MFLRSRFNIFQSLRKSDDSAKQSEEPSTSEVPELESVPDVDPEKQLQGT